MSDENSEISDEYFGSAITAKVHLTFALGHIQEQRIQEAELQSPYSVRGPLLQVVGIVEHGDQLEHECLAHALLPQHIDKVRQLYT